MTDQPITLTNVMIGLYKHDLINRTTEEEWTFLTGLILYANDKWFKNPIDLSVKQACGAGGGNNRQSVNRRRNALKKIKIDGHPILIVTAGKPGENRVALYEIRYDLICLYNGVRTGRNAEASQIYDGKRTEGGREADGSRDHPKIRSDQKREDKITTTEAVVVLPSADEQIQETKSDRLVVQGAVLNRYRSQIMDRLPSDPATTTLLELYPVHQILEALERMPLVLTPKDNRAVTGNYALGMVEKWIKNPSWGVPDGGNGGAAQSMGERDRADVANELVLMKEDLARLEAKTDGDWSEHILAMQVAIAEAEVG